VNDTEEVLALGERLRKSGLLLIDEMNMTRCYAVQDKVWVYDPDGKEIVYTKEDSEFESTAKPVTCRSVVYRLLPRYLLILHFQSGNREKLFDRFFG
jgi:hypothetical protein